MEETRAAGGKEFVFSVLWTILLLLIGKYIIFALPQYKVIGTIITILMFCVLGFFVLTRYAAVYTYTLKNDRFRANRKIGHRNKETDFALSGVRVVTKRRPDKKVKHIQTMRTSVFSSKNIWYIVYDKNGVSNMLVCEISKNMADKIRSRAKNTKLHSAERD